MKQDDFLQVLGHRIKKFRKAKGLSQEQLAEAIDKSVDTISNVERRNGSTSLDTVFKIANALDVQIFELFQVHDMSSTDKKKMQMLDSIVDLLKDQPEEILHFTLEQTKQLVSLKEGFIDKLKK